MILKEVIDRTTQFFKEKKFETARLDTELLLSKALGLSRIELYLKFDKPLSDIELQKCRDFVRRRASGEPVAYILEEKDFYGNTFKVGPGVLIPRPETEILVDEALRWMRKKNIQDTPLKVLDLGAGTGCISLSILKKTPQAQATLVELSKQAYQYSLANIDKLNLQNRTQLLQQSAEETIEGPFDIILSNPPYIADQDTNVQATVVEFEPKSALFSGPLGTEMISQWFHRHISSLKSPGFIGFEIGKDQGEFTRQLFLKSGQLNSVHIVKDMAGFDRHVIGLKD